MQPIGKFFQIFEESWRRNKTELKRITVGGDALSTSAMIGEEPQPNLNLLLTEVKREKQTTYLAVKLNQL